MSFIIVSVCFVLESNSLFAWTEYDLPIRQNNIGINTTNSYQPAYKSLGVDFDLNEEYLYITSLYESKTFKYTKDFQLQCVINLEFEPPVGQNVYYPSDVEVDKLGRILVSYNALKL